MSRKRKYQTSSESRDSSVANDEVGHYYGKEDDFIKDNRYKIKRELGKGTFGKVFKCFDTKHKEFVAIKIIRKISRYIDSAMIETDILDDIYKKQKATKENCNSDIDFCVKMYANFNYNGHYCIVFERLGVSLYDLVKTNDYKPFPFYYIKNIAKQLLQALDFLKSINLIHTDLKLENVLFAYNSLEKIKINFKEKIFEIFVPSNIKIKLIDFGGATYDDDKKKSTTINTRQYRGPEVILEIGWSFPSDIWSAACIIAEICTGDLLFQTHDEIEHLGLMERALGHFPKAMVKESEYRKKYFKDDLVRVDDLRSESRRHVRDMQTFAVTLRNSNCFDSEKEIENVVELMDLLLKIDPHKRATAKDALLATAMFEIEKEK